MGVDSNLYIGPYLTVDVEIEGKDYDMCKNPGECPAGDLDAGFCPKCGIDLTKRFRHAEVSTVNFYELIGDALTGTHPMTGPPKIERDGKKYEQETLIPNHRRDGQPDRQCHFDGRESFQVDFSDDVDAAYEVEWLSEAFSEEIDKIEAAAGNCTIHWGIVQWFS